MCIRDRYRYEGDLLVDVVHTDEGITHYEYDENGHISSVTDQNGSCYLENEYDVKGRVTRQNFSSGVYQTFTYDDICLLSTSYLPIRKSRPVSIWIRMEMPLSQGRRFVFMRKRT